MPINPTIRRQSVDPTLFQGDTEATQALQKIQENNAGQAVTWGDLEAAIRTIPDRREVLLRMLKGASSPKSAETKTPLELNIAEIAPAETRGPPAEVVRFRKALDRYVVGQEDAKDTLSRFYQTLQTGYVDKPMVLLQVGPPGVGKTQMSKALGHGVHDDPDSVIFIDCAALTNETMLGKYIGIGPGFVGYGEDCVFSPENIQKKTHGKRPVIIHIDEPDKMPPNVANHFWNMMNRFLETGQIENGKNETVDLCDTGDPNRKVGPIVIMASNAGSDKAAGLTGDALKRHFEKAGRESIAKHTNSRIDAIVPFRPLVQEERELIVGIELDSLFKRARAEAAGVGLTLGFTSDAKVNNLLAQLAASDQLGARPVKSAVQQLVAYIVKQQVVQCMGNTREYDESRYELRLTGDIDPKWLNEMRAEFAANEGKVPASLTTETFPVRMVLKNPPPKFFEYQGQLPCSDYAQFVPFGAGACAGRGYLVGNLGEIDSPNQMWIHKAGRNETDDTFAPVALPEELAQANLGLSVVTIDEPKDIVDPEKRNNRALFVGTHAPDDGKHAESYAYIYDPIGHRNEPFQKIPPPPVPLFGATLGSVDGQVVIWGGRVVDRGLDGQWSVTPDPQGLVGAPIENEGYVLHVSGDGELEWKPITGRAQVGRCGAGVAEVDGKLAFIGGEEVARTPQGASFTRASASVDLYDPKDGQIAPGWPLATGVAYARVDVDDFRRLRLKGGLEYLDAGLTAVPRKGVLALDPELGKTAAWKTRDAMSFAGSHLISVPHVKGGVITGPFFTDEGETKWLIEKSPVAG
jgi:hypothetical protein